jgi:hypothetical protein
MENCCFPIRRLRVKLDGTNIHTEVQLTKPVGDLLVAHHRHRGFRCWDDVYFFVRKEKNLVWVSPTAFITTSADEHLFEAYDYELYFGVEWRHWTYIEGEEERLYLYTHKQADESPTLAAEFLRQLLAKTEKGKGALWNLKGACRGRNSGLVSGSALSRLLSVSDHHTLGSLTFERLTFVEEHWLALTAARDLDLDIVFENCTIAETGYGAFLEFLQRTGGAISLCSCTIDAETLACALRGNTSISELRLHSYEADSDYISTVAQALSENEGLESLYLAGGVCVNDETWKTLFRSIQKHPQLEVLGLIRTGGLATTLSAESKTTRMQVIVDMLQSPNRIIRRISLSEDEQDAQIYKESILPHLQANTYRPRVQRMQQTRDRSRKEGLLGRALYTVRRQKDLVWMLLSENAEILAAAFKPNERDSSNSDSTSEGARKRKGHP